MQNALKSGKISFSIKKMNLDNLTSVIFDDVVHDTQICYHLVYPKNLNLRKKLKKSPQSSGQMASKKRRRRGRPRKEEVMKFEEVRRASEQGASNEKLDDQNVQLACSRTRYGRVSRPPKHMSKFVEIKEPRSSATSDANSNPMDTTENRNTFSCVEQFVNENKTKILPEPRKVRKNVDRFTCSVCKKVYLGRKKLLKHYLAFPDHKTSIKSLNSSNQFHMKVVGGPNSLLFNELIKIVGSAPQPDRISLFLAEISNFVSKIQLFKSKIIHVEDVSSSLTEYYLDKHVSKVLGLPEGLLKLNDKAFENLQQNDNMFQKYIVESPTIDCEPHIEMSSIGSLPEIGYNLDLFPEVNYDQISDNAVEAEALGKSNLNAIPNDNPSILEIPTSPILDISLDLFSFDSIK